jgi:LacI family transcriptional regulator
MERMTLTKHRLATLADVAEHAGVSTSTVSLFINGKLHRMGKATQAKVAQALDAVGYTMDPIARSLSTGKTMTVGLAWDASNYDYYFEDVYFMYFAKMVANALSPHGYGLTLVDLQDLKIKSRTMDGLIVKATSTTWDDVTQLKQLSPALPVVSLGKFGGESHVPSVSVDDVGSGQAGIEYLASKHRRIHLLSFPAGRIVGFDERVEGATRAAERLGIALTTEYGEMSQDFGEEVVQRRHRDGSLPHALFCLNDITAVGALKAARDLGLDVPSQLSILGVDDTPSVSYCLGLSTIRHPIGDLAQAATKAVLWGIEHPSQEGQGAVLETRVMVRSTT